MLERKKEQDDNPVTLEVEACYKEHGMTEREMMRHEGEAEPLAYLDQAQESGDVTTGRNFGDVTEPFVWGQQGAGNYRRRGA